MTPYTLPRNHSELVDISFKLLSKYGTKTTKEQLSSLSVEELEAGLKGLKEVARNHATKRLPTWPLTAAKLLAISVFYTIFLNADPLVTRLYFGSTLFGLATCLIIHLEGLTKKQQYLCEYFFDDYND